MSPIECRRTIPDAASHIRHIQKGVPDQEYNQAGSDLFNEAMGVGGAVDTHGHIRGHQIAVQDSNSKNLLKIDNFVTDLNSSDISPNGPSPEKVFKIDGKKKEKMSARRNRSEFRNSHQISHANANEEREQSEMETLLHKATAIEQLEEQTHREILDISSKVQISMPIDSTNQSNNLRQIHNQLQSNNNQFSENSAQSNRSKQQANDTWIDNEVSVPSIQKLNEADAGHKVRESKSGKKSQERQRLFRVEQSHIKLKNYPETQKQKQYDQNQCANNQKQQIICIRSSLEDKSISELIDFFKVDYKNQKQQIYAHKEFFVLKPGQPARTKIKHNHQIIEILQKESLLLVQYMKRTYNIDLPIDPQTKCILDFPLRSRWLRGEEYGFLCRHYYAYTKIFKKFQVGECEHPDSIYNNPQYGQFYYIKGMHLQYFGFPRKNSDKNYVQRVQQPGEGSGCIAPESSNQVDKLSSREQERASDNASSKSSSDTKSIDGSSSSPPTVQQADLQANIDAINNVQNTQGLQGHPEAINHAEKRKDQMNLNSKVDALDADESAANLASNKFKKFKWKKTNFKTPLPKHDPIVIYVTANTKNRFEHQCMMHAGSLAQEFDQIYTQKGHGRQLRANHRKLTLDDLNADLQVHERIVFCHVLDMRDSVQKKMQAIAATEGYPEDVKQQYSHEKQGPPDCERSSFKARTLMANVDMNDGSSESNNQNKILRKRAKKFDFYPDHKTLQRVEGDQGMINREVNDLCQPIQKRNGRYGPRGKYKKRQQKNEKSINEAQTQELLFGKLNEQVGSHPLEVQAPGPQPKQQMECTSDEKQNGILHFNNLLNIKEQNSQQNCQELSNAESNEKAESHSSEERLLMTKIEESLATPIHNIKKNMEQMQQLRKQPSQNVNLSSDQKQSPSTDGKKRSDSKAIHQQSENRRITRRHLQLLNQRQGTESILNTKVEELNSSANETRFITPIKSRGTQEKVQPQEQSSKDKPDVTKENFFSSFGPKLDTEMKNTNRNERRHQANDVGLQPSKFQRITRNQAQTRGAMMVQPIDQHISKFDLGNNKQIYFRELKTDSNQNHKTINEPIMKLAARNLFEQTDLNQRRPPKSTIIKEQYSSDSASSSTQNCQILVHNQQGEENIEESNADNTSQNEPKEVMENSFENTDGEMLSASQLAKKQRQLNILDQIKVEHLNYDVDDEDSSLQIIENFQFSPMNTNNNSSNQANKTKDEQQQFLERRNFLDKEIDSLFRRLVTELEQASLVPKIENARTWNSQSKSPEELQSEWNSLSAVQDLNLTKKMLVDYYRRWKNKHMVKEFYYKAKIKDIKKRLSQYYEMCSKHFERPHTSHKKQSLRQPSLQEALFSNKHCQPNKDTKRQDSTQMRQYPSMLRRPQTQNQYIIKKH